MKKFLILVFLLLGMGLAFAAPSSDEGVLSEGLEVCIDINTATFDELQNIAHIGIDEAIQILRFRRVVDFRFVEDLSYIAGLNVTELGDIQTEGLACVPVPSVSSL